MKHIFTFLTLVSSLVVFCQAPNAMSYQAVIRDASNELVASQLVGMQISILQGSASSTSVYTETQSPSTNANGLVSISIGEGTTNHDFSSIDWADGPYFIKTETDVTGGSDYSITGTTQLLSVPYAIHASNGFARISEDGDTLFLSNGQYFLSGGSKEDTSQMNYIIDVDGNSYHSVIIGDQEWMVGNLRTSKYSNGDPIPNVTDDSEWQSLSTGAYCWHGNDNSNEDIYGKLYNWYAVDDSRNICPIGWHVPSDAEWTVLDNYLESNGHLNDGIDLRGTALKSTEGWGDINGTDDYGFNALPAGNREAGFINSYIGYHCYFWCSTEYNDINNSNSMYAWYRMMDNVTGLFKGYFHKYYGYSVRCLKD